MNTTQHTPDPRHTAIPLMAVVYRGFDTAEEVYRLHDLKPMSATKMVEAINAHDELVAALRSAIVLLQQWHDEPDAEQAYRFDLTDHPKVKPLYAALAKVSA